MCSIFGMGLFTDHTVDDTTAIKDMMAVLLEKAEVNGKSASGVAIMRAKSTEVIRRAMSGSKLAQDTDYVNFADEYMKVGKDEVSADDHLISIIGHCRLPTQGSVSNNYNNHPVIAENIIGVHNGVIGNDDVLFNKFRKSITRIAQVDTEIIFQLVSHFTRRFGTNKTTKAIRETATYLKGGYACGMLNIDSPHNLFLFRHGPEIKILYYPEVKALLFATRESFILDAVGPFKNYLGDYVEIEIESDTGITFNLHNKTMCKFKL